MCSPEYFRTPDNVMLPDTRCKHISIEQLYSELLQYSLDPNVPAHITAGFDTAKNLYLYTWFVYDFLPVADKQTLAVLEAAFKTRLDELNIARKEKDDLWKLLPKAEQQELIQWEDLPEDIVQTHPKPRHLGKYLKKVVKEHLSDAQTEISVVTPSIEEMDLQLLSETTNPLSPSQPATMIDKHAIPPTSFLLPRFGCALINALYTVQSP